MKIRFTDTPPVPRKVRLFELGGAVQRSYAGKPTTKVVPPHWLYDGEVVDMSDEQAAWYRAMYPENFKPVEAKAQAKTAHPLNILPSQSETEQG